MTISERRKLALLEHQHRQLLAPCKRLALAIEAYNFTCDPGKEEMAIAARDAAIDEIEKLLHKWELIE